jgi:hypothetical protein
MRVIERFNCKGQSVLLFTTYEGSIPIRFITDYDENGYKLVGFGTNVRIYEDKQGNQLVYNISSLDKLDF